MNDMSQSPTTPSVSERPATARPGTVGIAALLLAIAGLAVSIGVTAVTANALGIIPIVLFALLMITWLPGP